MLKPTEPEMQFAIKGLSFLPFDTRRKVGPWSERNNYDVYGNYNGYLKWIIHKLKNEKD